MSWYLQVLRKYAVFSGRARPKEYWMFTLVNVLIGFVLSIPIFLTQDQGTVSAATFISYAYSLAMVIPSLAVTVRRLHDTNHSGWWYFIALVPLVGAILLLVWFCSDSDPGANKYGPNPKEEFELRLA